VRQKRSALGLEEFIEPTGVDELIVVSALYDHTARLQSYELLVEQGKSR
jgi:hypothetical protein